MVFFLSSKFQEFKFWLKILSHLRKFFATQLFAKLPSTFLLMVKNQTWKIFLVKKYQEILKDQFLWWKKIFKLSTENILGEILYIFKFCFIFHKIFSKWCLNYLKKVYFHDFARKVWIFQQIWKKVLFSNINLTI